MNLKQHSFNELITIDKIKHYLPAQGPLKDFIHHNTLHFYQDKPFFEAIFSASKKFGYNTHLNLEEYRNLYHQKRIKFEVIEQILKQKNIVNTHEWLEKLISKKYTSEINMTKTQKIKNNWEATYKLNLNQLVHPILFKIISSYLDQGISSWGINISEKGLLMSVLDLNNTSYYKIFKSKRVKKIIQNNELNISTLLNYLITDEQLFEQYLFEQQFAHPGWSGLISYIEDNPNCLFRKRNISIQDTIILELLLEIEVLDEYLGKTWSPITHNIRHELINEDKKHELNEYHDIIMIWQNAYEWSYFKEVINGIVKGKKNISTEIYSLKYQALFCIDDRECSLRRYLEQTEPNIKTYGTPGHFNVSILFKPHNSKQYIKSCPAPVTPKHIVKEYYNKNKSSSKEIHFLKHSHNLFSGWLITQTVGIWSAYKLFSDIFKPSLQNFSNHSFNYIHKNSTLSVEHHEEFENNIPVGFTTYEMTLIVEDLLKNIGMNVFSDLIYVISHGASSVNNTHYAGYDCGACSGKPGIVNARAFCYMANHKEVRVKLREKNINIPDTCKFIPALHDTTRDEIIYYDVIIENTETQTLHKSFDTQMNYALKLNAKERAEKLFKTTLNQNLEQIHHKIKLRSISLFEPRPELNHANNAICVIGNRSLTESIDLNRRSFLNSYDYLNDPFGERLSSILNAIVPVCGGINMEYYFSRVDNKRLGAGTKLPHNVMGLIAVANGTEGDIKPGLPKQMIEIHEPLRLLLVIEQKKELVLKIIKNNPKIYPWIKNEWMHLIVLDTETLNPYIYSNEEFNKYDLY